MKSYHPASSRPPRTSRAPRRQIPPFHAVPLRARVDGWTPLRQAEFIGMLAQTRSVAKAARWVGMGRESAYRLRGRPGSASFCAAWDAAMATARPAPLPLAGGVGGGLGLGHSSSEAHPAATRLASSSPSLTAPPVNERGKESAPHHSTRKCTLAELEWRVETGLWQVILHKGRYGGVRKKLDESALLMLTRRLDVLDRRAMDRLPW